MPAPNARQNVQDVPLKIVGGNHFGRYPKISDEQTFNMMITDGWLANYAGYKNITTLSNDSKGRTIYSSTKCNCIFAVVGRQVFQIEQDFTYTIIGNLQTAVGDVFIAENNANEIGITDGLNIYVYNYSIGPASFTTLLGSGFSYDFTPFRPGHISFQNGRFVVAALGTNQWILSNVGSAISYSNWPNNPQNVGSLETKPDTVQAAIPFPGRGNLLFLFGYNVTELWTDVGSALFPYQRNSSANIDYGCLNPASIGQLGEEVVWLGGNERSGPVLMYSNGGPIQEISTDGMDFKFSTLTNPTDCSGFLMKIAGHLIYQFTFKTDNLSYMYDFDTKEFSTLTDENLNYHIAREVVFYNNQYYFVSYNDGNLYEISISLTKYEYSPDKIHEIPRIRICSPFRLPSQRPFIVKSLGFTIENGLPNSPIPAESAGIDLSISRDGGENFSSAFRYPMNAVGNRKSRLIFQRLGRANDFTAQIKFWGFERFLATDGIMEVYQ